MSAGCRAASSRQCARAASGPADVRAPHGRFYLVHASTAQLTEPAATVGIKQALDLPFG